MYYVLTFIAAIVGRCSPRVLERFAWFMAVVWFDVLRFRRRLILKNLQIAFPDLPPQKRQRIGRASIYNFLLTMIEVFWSQTHDIISQVKIMGAEHVHQALAGGRGAYLLCCHIGNWEVHAAAVTRLIAPSCVLIKKVGSDSMNRWLNERRAANGFLGVVRRKRGDGFLAIQKALGRNEMVGFVMDQSRPGEPRLEFFGTPAKTNTSLAGISQRIPAPIIPTYGWRTGINQHTIEFLPALALPVSGDTEADILKHSLCFNRAVEDIIKRHPEQYFWLHNRWK